MIRLSFWSKIGLGVWVILSLVGCAALSPENYNNRYQLIESAKIPNHSNSKHLSILVMRPVGLDGYDSDKMLYVNQRFQVNSFARNAWLSPPSVMLLPLLIRSIESSHYFFAVASDLNTSKTDYRLESALIRLQQNFLMKPSHLELIMQVILIHNSDNRVVATETIYQSIPCSSDSPLGGVIAANFAARKLSSRVAHFVIDQVVSEQGAS